MRKILVGVVGLVLASAAGRAAAALPEPLGPASEGRLQCFEPNAAAKTCRSTASYRPAGDIILNLASVMVSSDPVTVMRTVTPVQVVDGAVCGTLRARHIGEAEIQVDGQRLEPEEAARVRQQLVTDMASVLEKRICTTFTADGDGWTVKATIDGAPQTGLEQRVIWVGAQDGWRVGP
jgi:hypothetical protein